ncbi:MAG TPA: outer membrane protein assembly factor BamD [Chitinophagaceae bacterium]|jgi:outer membrane protein assembly factor BamD|nr:outer membrane protein assembly factor BamD [Chitinophagaceae bacterium]
MRVFLLFIIVGLLSGCGGINKILKNKDPEYKLRMAEQYFVKKKYNYAQSLYEDVMPNFKGTAIFEDLYYKYAYCAYYQKDYLNAENLFKNFLEAFPNSPKAEELDYMRAYCYYKMSPKTPLDQNNTVKAMGMLQTFINTHPGSPKNKEANELIDICRLKLEEKERLAARLYYDLGQFRAAGVSYTTLINDFPDSEHSDEYKLMVIKSYYKFAELSVDERKVERYEQVIAECNDFMDRFPDSKLVKEVERYISLTNNNIKKI